MALETFLERLETLKGEFDKGQQQLALIEQKRLETQETLLRISGAIQVLEELLAQQKAVEA